MDTNIVPVEIQGVHGYVDANGTAWLKLEDVARGLEFTRAKNDVEYIMWDRVRQYLSEVGYSIETVRRISDAFIPENVFYRLIWKSRSQAAKEFQNRVADEILPAIRQKAMLSQILSNPARLAEALGITDFEPDKKCAYVFEMDNGTVKIGVTQDFDRRINEVMNGSGMNVVRHFHTAPLNRKDAFRAEAACHKTFANERKRGEFFTTDFDDACNELKHHAKENEP